MEKMRRARYKFELKLETQSLIGAGQSIAAAAAPMRLANQTLLLRAPLLTPRTQRSRARPDSGAGAGTPVQRDAGKLAG